jgi:hypothetical protein
VRSSNINPIEDIGIYYFSSSSDKEFIKNQKENPENYKYKVIRIFKSKSEALNLEIKLHNKFDVGINENFYNRSKQTSTGFDVTGRTFSMSEETKRKISEKLKGRKKEPFSEEHKENIKRRRKDQIITEEHKRNLSITAKGREKPPRTKEHRQRLGKIINIFDSNGNLKFECKGNFKEVCDFNKLPFKQLKKSYQNDGLKIYENLSNASKSALNRDKQLINMYTYKGWYAKIV